MGEHEQGGMLRNVVVLGLIALISSIAIFLVIGLKANMFNSVKDTSQKSDLAKYDYDLNTSISAQHGNLISINSNNSGQDLIKWSYIGKNRSGDELKKVSANYDVRLWNGNLTDYGLQYEMYLNQSLLKYLVSNSDSDYLYFAMDYHIKNGQKLTKDQAKALNIDTYRDTSLSGITIGIRSDEYKWAQNKTITPTGDSSGTITMTAPKSKIGSSYDFYLYVTNYNFDEMVLDNMHVSNADIFK